MTILTHDTDHSATGETLLGNVAHAIANGARAVARGYIAHRQHSAQRLLVASLTDHQLRDLGISRDQVPTRDFIDPYAI